MHKSSFAIFAVVVAACSGSAQAEKDPRCGHLINDISVFDGFQKTQKKWSKSGFPEISDEQISPRSRNMGMGETYNSVRKVEFSNASDIYAMKKGEERLTWSEHAVYGHMESKKGVHLQRSVMGLKDVRDWHGQPYAPHLKKIAKKFCGEEQKSGCRVNDNTYSINLQQPTDDKAGFCMLRITYNGFGVLNEHVQYNPAVE